MQSERFRGILLPFVRRAVLPATLQGFEAMNRALADRAAATKADGRVTTDRGRHTADPAPARDRR